MLKSGRRAFVFRVMKTKREEGDKPEGRDTGASNQDKEREKKKKEQTEY